MLLGTAEIMGIRKTYDNNQYIITKEITVSNKCYMIIMLSKCQLMCFMDLPVCQRLVQIPEHKEYLKLLFACVSNSFLMLLIAFAIFMGI